MGPVEQASRQKEPFHTELPDHFPRQYVCVWFCACYSISDLTLYLLIASEAVPYQTNTWDCGVFVCHYIHAIYMLRNKQFTFADLEQSKRGIKRNVVPIIDGCDDFSFTMEDISSTRQEMKTLIKRLSQLFVPWKQNREESERATKRKKLQDGIALSQDSSHVEVVPPLQNRLYEVVVEPTTKTSLDETASSSFKEGDILPVLPDSSAKETPITAENDIELGQSSFSGPKRSSADYFFVSDAQSRPLCVTSPETLGSDLIVDEKIAGSGAGGSPLSEKPSNMDMDSLLVDREEMHVVECVQLQVEMMGLSQRADPTSHVPSHPGACLADDDTLSKALYRSAGMHVGPQQPNCSSGTSSYHPSIEKRPNGTDVLKC